MSDQRPLPGADPERTGEAIGRGIGEDFREYVKVVERRLWIIVIPSLIAFVLLAAYGFYLIFTLNQDMRSMASQMAAMSPNVQRNMNIMASAMTAMSPNVQHNMDRITTQMSKMTASIHSMTHSMDAMRADMRNIDAEMQKMDNHMQGINARMDKMNAAITYMAWATGQIQLDMWSMNQNVSAPFSMFSAFVPWGSNQGPYPGPNRPLPPPSGLGPPPAAAYYPPPEGRSYYPSSRQNTPPSQH